MTPHRLLTTAFSAVAMLLPSMVLAQAPLKPKLVVVVVIDQFRYDYLTRFRQDYHGGLNRLLSQGADFTNGFYAQIPTVTAVGHSMMLSGAMPAASGIVGNSWYDRAEGKVVTSVCDWTVTVVGAPQPKEGDKCTDSDPASPKRLLVSTLGDELKDAHPESKVIGVSIKARGAILPSGHAANGAFWFDDETGNFVTSSFYMEKLPAWAEAFNNQKLAAKYVDQPWDGFAKWDFHSKGNAYSKLPASPWGNELIEKFAESAIKGEKLGQRGVTDLLTVSFSSNDYVGHAVGPNAPEVRDMAIRTDQLLGKLFDLIDKGAGMNNTVVVLSADHGVAATPLHDEETHMPGGYVKGNPTEIVEHALVANFGGGSWLIPGAGETSLYLNWKQVLRVKKPSGESLEEDDIYHVASSALLAAPDLHVARVYTREQLENGLFGDFIALAQMNGFNPKRSGDINIVFEPGYITGSSGTSHFSPWAYDRHVPMLLMGPGIKPGRYDANVEVNDIAPTLATLLDIQTPSGSSGRVLPALTH
jgi:predicted AlkP superfamily pyrophosphatase or phosphodiesterase